jgi:hypothetical protein
MAIDHPSGGASALLQFFSTVLLTLWAGSLWAVCFIAAPTVFATLPEKHLAGQVVGRLFHIETWLGVIAAALLIGLLTARKMLTSSRTALLLILLTAASPLISELVVGPMMDQARAANDMASFGRLHGVSAALFLTACVGAFALVWKLNPRPAR